MGQLEQTPFSKFIADALGWFLLVAAITSLIALAILILPLFTDPESSLIRATDAWVRRVRLANALGLVPGATGNRPRRHRSR